MRDISRLGRGANRRRPVALTLRGQIGRKAERWLAKILKPPRRAYSKTRCPGQLKFRRDAGPRRREANAQFGMRVLRYPSRRTTEQKNLKAWDLQVNAAPNESACALQVNAGTRQTWTKAGTGLRPAPAPHTDTQKRPRGEEKLWTHPTSRY